MNKEKNLNFTVDDVNSSTNIQQGICSCGFCESGIIKENKYGFFCSNKSCKAGISFNNKFLLAINQEINIDFISSIMTKKEFYSKNLKSKTGKTFSALIKAEKKDKYINFSLDFDSPPIDYTAVCTCPYCEKAYILEYQNGFFCSNKNCKKGITFENKTLQRIHFKLDRKSARKLFRTNKCYQNKLYIEEQAEDEDGTQKKKRKNFSATIYMEYDSQYPNFKIEYEKYRIAENCESNVDDAPIFCDCPNCTMGTIHQLNYATYKCDNSKCNFTFNVHDDFLEDKEIKLSKSQIKSLFLNGETNAKRYDIDYNQIPIILRIAKIESKIIKGEKPFAYAIFTVEDL